MLSTIHRRHIRTYLEEQRTTSLRDLKSRFIDTNEMNQTTLYRILEKFTEEGVIHRAEFSGEKYYTLCQCTSEEESAIKLKCCMKCHRVEDAHSPLPPDTMKSETIELVRTCTLCKTIEK